MAFEQRHHIGASQKSSVKPFTAIEILGAGPADRGGGHGRHVVLGVACFGSDNWKPAMSGGLNLRSGWEILAWEVGQNDGP